MSQGDKLIDTPIYNLGHNLGDNSSDNLRLHSQLCAQLYPQLYIGQINLSKLAFALKASRALIACAWLPVRIIVLLAMLLTLAACDDADIRNPGIQIPQPGEANPPQDEQQPTDPKVELPTDQVYNLQAFPGNNSIILRWDNPTVAANITIASFNLTVYDVRDKNAVVAAASNANLTAADGVNIISGARSVEYNITNGLKNQNVYSFAIHVNLVNNTIDIIGPVTLLNNRRGDALVVIGPNQDGDEYADIEDSCPASSALAIRIGDPDKDGCYGPEDAFPNDPLESHDKDGDFLGNNIDPDDDNDGVLDRDDSCSLGVTEWTSTSFLDYDGDGCHDTFEDADDDNDRVADLDDFCPLGEKNWLSASEQDYATDYDGDGCRDAFEDVDDDGDRIMDLLDTCQLSNITFVSKPENDNDGDGCHDVAEDADDDNDGVVDYATVDNKIVQDNCQFDYNPSQLNTDNDTAGDVCDDDDDGDTVLDIDDVDDNGNGLIEIATAQELNRIRYNLAGTSLQSAGNNNSAAAQGCIASSPFAVECHGYELVADIRLEYYGEWEPLGSCTGSAATNSLATCSNQDMFAGIFEGNNHTITNLTITRNGGGDFFGVGLFGAVAPTAELRNIRLLDVAIQADVATTLWYVGALAGVADGATIIASSATNGSVNGNYFVGGLVGSAHNGTRIGYSHTNLKKVESRYKNVGGLVGSGGDCSIMSSYALTEEINSLETPGGGRAGGLAGSLVNCSTRHSYAVVDKIGSTDEYVGGLVGRIDDSTIHSSYALSGVINTDASYAGGFAGMVSGSNTSGSEIYASISRTDDLIGASNVSGFIGVIDGTSSIGFSYAFRGDDPITQGASQSAGENEYFIVAAPQSNITLFNSYYVATTEDVLWAGPVDSKVTSSYWDSDASLSAADDAKTTARTTAELQGNIDFGTDYADWNQGWCDSATGEFTTDANLAQERGYLDNEAWHLGSSSQYPAISCLNSLTAAQQFALPTIKN
ncbi:MAG: hypothetical protein K0U41_03485 [Gammaproteobacteria bacterium]|nr:hypothetical protein [Gammaproteobacteria bacterium]